MNDLVFRCRKCEHLLFVNKEKVNFEIMAELTEKDCVNCGESAGDYLILDRVGNFEKEYGGEADGE